MASTCPPQYFLYIESISIIIDTIWGVCYYNEVSISNDQFSYNFHVK